MMGSGGTQRSGSAPVAGAREVRVTAREFSFTPAEFRLRAGETVNVLLENRGPSRRARLGSACVRLIHGGRSASGPPRLLILRLDAFCR